MVSSGIVFGCECLRWADGVRDMKATKPDAAATAWQGYWVAVLNVLNGEAPRHSWVEGGHRPTHLPLDMPFLYTNASPHLTKL